MKNLFLRALLSLGVVALASCAQWTALASPEERAEHWRSIMPLEVPLGSTRADLEDWLKERELEFHEAASPRRMVFEVEEVAGDGWICSVWLIRVKALLGEDDIVERYEIDKQGVCL